MTHGARHAARPNLDYNVPQTCPSPHREPRVVTSRAVFKEIPMSKEHQHSENGGFLVQNNAEKRKPLKSPYPLLPENTLSAHHARRTARIAPKPPRLYPDGVPLSAGVLLSVCANGARTRRYERKSTKKHKYK